ncbi:purine/pyrimidine permease [Moorella naiadis]|uniref:purine/pyrimidine permease n=1 Tax=Moorella naiadis (nom. illeg.) TaxID=3093670 RepID=UPI003D9C7DC4
MPLLYALQWVAFHLGMLITIPVVVGNALHLDPVGVATLTQRVFFFTGLASLLQVFIGHRLLLIEGPAAPWWAAYVILASITAQMGVSFALLRTDLEGAMLVAGAMLMAAALLGLLRRLLPLFTPAINGTVLLLLSLQIGGIGVKGILNSGSGRALDGRLVVIALVVLLLIVFLSLRARGVWRTGAVIFGVAGGWLLYHLWGFQANGNTMRPGTSLLSLPGVFPWGLPTFNPGIIFSLVLLGIVLIPNAVISITAMESLINTQLPRFYYDRGLFVSGLSDFLAGLFASVGSIPFTSSVGLVAISGVKERLPFILATLIFMLAGLLPAVGALVARIPPPVANAVLLASASPLAIYALKDYARCPLNNRDAFVIGLSLLIGTGIMLLPGETWQQLPGWAANILGNGVIAGSLSCILMEHLVLPRPLRR